MNNASNFPNGTDTNPDQEIAREGYFRLREQLSAMQASSNPDAQAIDAVVKALEQAQLKYKATHGLNGNNPIAD